VLKKIKELIHIRNQSHNLIDRATKENQDWTKCWIYMSLWMQIGLEICIIGYLHVSMCLTCLEEK
jgi:hypothetical protein